MDIWHWTPLVTLTLLAALSSLPKEPFEQAQIDGANRWQIFWHITLPMIRPAILATVFIRLMDALRTVDEVWMLTGGGPGAATRYIGLYIWRVVFPKTDYGYGVGDVAARRSTSPSSCAGCSMSAWSRAAARQGPNVMHTPHVAACSICALDRAASLVTLFPIYWMFVISAKSRGRPVRHARASC